MPREIGFRSTWTEREVNRLRQLIESGLPSRVIAERLNRTVIAIRRKAQAEGILARRPPRATAPARATASHSVPASPAPNANQPPHRPPDWANFSWFRGPRRKRPRR